MQGKQRRLLLHIHYKSSVAGTPEEDLELGLLLPPCSASSSERTPAPAFLHSHTALRKADPGLGTPGLHGSAPSALAPWLLSPFQQALPTLQSQRPPLPAPTTPSALGVFCKPHVVGGGFSFLSHLPGHSGPRRWHGCSLFTQANCPSVCSSEALPEPPCNRSSSNLQTSLALLFVTRSLIFVEMHLLIICFPSNYKP